VYDASASAAAATTKVYIINIVWSVVYGTTFPINTFTLRSLTNIGTSASPNKSILS
jgi:hypothetical protein